MGRVTQALTRITGRPCFETYRRCLDKERLSLLEYDYCDQEFMAQQGETIRYEGARDIASIAAGWAGHDPAFKLFLDGSRRTYKIVDMPIGSQVFPIVAGQVGVGVCKRESRRVAPCELMFDIVLAVPDKINPDGGGSRQNAAYCAGLLAKLNQEQSRVQINDVVFYSSQLKDRENFEDKAVSRIHDYMITHEKAMVDQLVQKRILTDRSWLIKDGSLEYSKVADKDDKFSFNRIRNNFRRVVGVSKSFNPELAKLKSNKSAAGLIARLQENERTPAAMYKSDRLGFSAFAVWYVRLRKPRYGRGPFDGIVKVEKVLVTDHEKEFGLESSEVDNISAWLLNERNPVCYGKDNRWANHLYPVYLTETYVKSKYRGEQHFVNLF